MVAKTSTIGMVLALLAAGGCGREDGQEPSSGSSGVTPSGAPGAPGARPPAREPEDGEPVARRGELDPKDGLRFELTARSAAPGAVTPEGREVRVDLQPSPAEGRALVDGLNAVIARHRGGLRQCFEQAMKVNPALTGRVVVKWTIGTDGAVPSASIVETTLSEDELETCLLARIGRIRFDNPRDQPIAVQIGLEVGAPLSRP